VPNANGISGPSSGCDSQEDDDGDQHGKECDADLDNDGAVLATDIGLIFRDFGLVSPETGADLDCDGFVLAFDLARLFGAFGGVPGPSGFHP
jgi:hypothetical protein